MTRLTYTLFLVLFCGGAIAQTEIILNLKHAINGSKLTQGAQGVNNLEQGFSVNRLEYYVSEITLTHDGGKETAIENTWLLVNPSKDSIYSLGSFDVDQLEKIQFHIGVDPEHNHADPSLYASGHPLAPKLPSMHWGWTAGYRFVALEGKAGSSMNITYEVHALGDDYYYPVLLNHSAKAAANKLEIDVHAEYSGLLRNISVNQGLIVHGAQGQAITLLKNFRDHVFSAPDGSTNVLNVAENIQTTGIRVYPNPSKGTFFIDQPVGAGIHVSVFNLQGQLIHSLQVSDQTKMIELPKGVYFLDLHYAEGAVERKKMIVQP